MPDLAALMIRPEEVASYIVFTDGVNVYAKNGKTGKIEFSGTDSSTVIQQAIDALLGKWGTVWIKGFITLTRGITLWSGIGLRGAKAGWGDTRGQLRIEDVIYGNFNEPIITIKNHPNYTSVAFFPHIADLAVIGGGNPSYTNNDGIYISGENGVVMDVFIRNVQVGFCGGHGFNIKNGGKHYLRDVYSEGNKGDGVYVESSYILKVDGAYIYGNTNGIRYTYIGGTLIVTNSFIRNNSQYGIDIYPAHKYNDVMIVGNSFLNNDASTSYANIRLWDVENYAIIGNSFQDDRSTKLTAYHISVNDARTNGVIIGNVFLDTAVNGVFRFNPRGSSIIKYNKGYISENSGTATIAAGSTRVTVSHGLAAAPSKVLATPYGNARVWVENITSTSFDIVTDTAPTSNLNIAWYAEV